MHFQILHSSPRTDKSNNSEARSATIADGGEGGHGAYLTDDAWAGDGSCVHTGVVLPPSILTSLLCQSRVHIPITPDRHHGGRFV